MLKKLIHEGDMFGIVTTGTSSISEQLTYDRQVLDSAISQGDRRRAKPKEIIEGSAGLAGPDRAAPSRARGVLDRLRPDEEPREAAEPAQGGHLHQQRLRLQSVREVAARGAGAAHARRQRRAICRTIRSTATQQSSQLLAEADLVRELAELTRAANRANATLYTIDPRGLVAGQDIDEEVPTQEWNAYVRETQDSLRVLAEETGGIAVVNQNDFDKALKRIDAETSDYYVLGYYSTNPDPLRRTRKIEVKTTRPSLNVWSRTSYSLRPIHSAGSAIELPCVHRAARSPHLGRAHRRFELRPHRLEHPDHLGHRARQPAHLRIEPAGLTHQRVAGDPAAEQLLRAARRRPPPATG